MQGGVSGVLTGPPPQFSGQKLSEQSHLQLEKQPFLTNVQPFFNLTDFAKGLGTGDAV